MADEVARAARPTSTRSRSARPVALGGGAPATRRATRAARRRTTSGQSSPKARWANPSRAWSDRAPAATAAPPSWWPGRGRAARRSWRRRPSARPSVDGQHQHAEPPFGPHARRSSRVGSQARVVDLLDGVAGGASTSASSSAAAIRMRGRRPGAGRDRARRRSASRSATTRNGSPVSASPSGSTRRRRCAGGTGRCRGPGRRGRGRRGPAPGRRHEVVDPRIVRCARSPHPPGAARRPAGGRAAAAGRSAAGWSRVGPSMSRTRSTTSAGSSSGRPRSTSRSSSRAARAQADGAEAAAGAGDDHAGEAGVHGQLGHGPPGGGDAAVGVDRAEVAEQGSRASSSARAGGGSRNARSSAAVPHTASSSAKPGEVDRLDLGSARRRRGRRAPAWTRGGRPPRARCARRGRHAGRPRPARSVPVLQAGEAAARVVARTADLAAVDHDPDAGDGEAGLGDVGGQHHPPATRRRRGQRQVLLGERQRAEQRPDVDVVGPATGARAVDSTRRMSAAPARNTSTSPVVVRAARRPHRGRRRLGDPRRSTRRLGGTPADVDRDAYGRRS